MLTNETLNYFARQTWKPGRSSPEHTVSWVALEGGQYEHLERDANAHYESLSFIQVRNSLKQTSATMGETRTAIMTSMV
jgi:hypothetical protein